MDKQQVEQATRAWVDKAVIGLNLCPFAKAVQVQGRVRYVVSEATTVEALLYELAAELNHLHDTPAETTDTTLLIHPQVLTDFLDYNDFLEAADALVEDIGLEGEVAVTGQARRGRLRPRGVEIDAEHACPVAGVALRKGEAKPAASAGDEHARARGGGGVRRASSHRQSVRRGVVVSRA